MTDHTDSPSVPATATCGDHGGRNQHGTPCVRAAGWGTPHRGTGLCKWHDATDAGGKHPATVAKRQAFLEAYRRTGKIGMAAEMAGVARETHYGWMNDPEYAAEFQAAERVAAGVLLDEAHRRAVDGVEEPAGWYQGQPGGFVRKYSDTLLIFLIKGSSEGHRFRERLEHMGKDGGPIQHKALVGLAELSDADLVAARDAALARALKAGG